MAIFSYTARTRDGGLVKGSYEASDKTIVVNSLKSKGYIPITVAPKTQASLDLSFLSKRVTTKEISVFCRQFATVIEAGIPVLECLDIIRKQTEGKRLHEILDRVFEQVQKGRSLSEGFREFSGELPPILMNMIEAGEVSGTLDKVMNRLASFFENENKLIRKVKGALTYPMVIAFVAIVAVILLLKFVVPQFVDIFSGTGTELPGSTKFIMALSDFVSKYFVFIIVFTVVVIIWLVRFLKTDKGKFAFDGLKLRIPKVSSLFRMMLTARFSRTMASLLAAGIPLIKALEVTDRVISNAIMSKYLAYVIESVSKGTKLSMAIAQVPIFPPMLTSMVSIGEESGSLDGILNKTADFYEEETEAEVEKVMGLIEPMLICTMAIVIGGIAVAMVQPMFGMFGAIQNI